MSVKANMKTTEVLRVNDKYIHFDISKRIKSIVDFYGFRKENINIGKL